MNSHTSLDSVARRILYVVLAAVMMLAGLPLLNISKAFAAPVQAPYRSITLSDSAQSGAGISTGVGSGTSVTYKVGFTASAGPASSMVIDFCSGSPIMQDTCLAPAGLDVSTAVLGATALSGTVDTTNGWTVAAAGPTNQVKLAEASAGAGDIVAGAQSFELSGITNPSTLGSFYARIYTYTGTAWAGYTSAASIGSPVDYGGIALSTTSTITITARVQESITFCVTNANPTLWVTNFDCTDPAITLPAITLGHGTGTAVLDAQNTDTASIWTQLSTNATHGAVIDLHNANACGGLSADNGVTCGIPAIASGGATPVKFDAGAILGGGAGTAGFGLYADTYVPTTGIGTTGAGGINTIGSVAPSATYNDGVHKATAPWTDGTFASGTPPTPYFAMDTTTVGNNTTSTYGSTVASCAGPVYRAENQYIFGATAGVSTPAGIYTANMSMISTGTF